MRRRQFITLLGGVAAAWPLPARAQQGERARRVGVLMNAAADDAEAQSYIAAFQQGMQELGWSVGRNLRIDLRWGGDDADRWRRYAEELLALSPDVIVAAGGAIVSRLQRVSRTVPIVRREADVDDKRRAPAFLEVVAVARRARGQRRGERGGAALEIRARPAHAVAVDHDPGVAVGDVLAGDRRHDGLIIDAGVGHQHAERLERGDGAAFELEHPRLLLE